MRDVEGLGQQAALFGTQGSGMVCDESGGKPPHFKGLTSALLDGGGEVGEDFFGGLPTLSLIHI